MIKFALAFLIQIHVSIATWALVSIMLVYNVSINELKFRTTCTQTMRFLFPCLFYFRKYTLMKITESSMVLQRQMTWKDIDPLWISSCLRTWREVKCKTESFLIYFYLGGFGSYSKLKCSIKDRTESHTDATQAETANWKYFPEPIRAPCGGLLSTPQRGLCKDIPVKLMQEGCIQCFSLSTLLWVSLPSLKHFHNFHCCKGLQPQHVMWTPF